MGVRDRVSASPRLLWVAALAGSIVVAVLSLQVTTPTLYYDAAVYVQAGQGIIDHGLFGAWAGADIRTYGYPLLTTVYSGLAHFSPLDVRSAAFLVQWPLLLGAAALLATSATRSRTLRPLLFAGVAANPFVVVRTTEVMTESVTVSLTLIAAAALLRAGQAVAAGRPRAVAAWILAGGLAAGLALETRPQAVAVVIAYGLAVAVLVLSAHRGRSLGTGLLVGVAVCGVVGLAVPMAPQAVINVRQFDRVSVLPVYELADLQGGAGMQMLRFATNVSGCGEVAVGFPNPYVDDVPVAKGSPTPTTNDALRFYATDWPEGPATALLHVFSGLDPRPFATYVTLVGAPYEPALQVGTVLLLLLAGIGGVAMSRSRARGRRTSGALEPGPVFLALAVVGTTALLAYSAAEYRFGVVLLTVAGLLVVPGVREVASWRRAGLLALALGAVVAVSGWLALSSWVLGMSPTWQQCAS